MAMEFWGVQVGSKPCKVEVDAGSVLHISQATLGEIKKDNEAVTLYVEIGEEKQKFVLGMLSQNAPQLSFDLVFDQEFEISHNWKDGSVHVLGYQAESGDPLDFDDDENTSDEDEAAMALPPKAVAKASALAAKAKKADNGKSEEEEDDDSDLEDSSDDDTALTMSDDSDEDEDGSEEEDEKPSKVENGKKRPNPDVETPVSKKAKVTPKKTDGKEVHSATPHPMKKGGKTPGGDKATPKSGSQHSCGSCSKTFSSQGALDSHSKAKHSAKA